jgi:phosphatidylglycerol:prolipoprotein diacylglycerol transferase
LKIYLGRIAELLSILQIGSAAIPTSALIILVSLWLGLSLAEKVASRYRVDPDTLFNLVIIGLISGIIGARLVFAASHLEPFLQSPLNLLSRNSGLLDPFGGAASGVIAMLVYGNRKNLALWPILDALTPLLAIIAVGMGFSHLASGNAFGMETNLPWGIQLWGMKRHPSQIYEILAALLILWMIWPQTGKARSTQREVGETFLFFLALSAGSRLFLEAFRGDSLILIGNIRTVQVWAWLVLALSLWGLRKLRVQTPHEKRRSS